MATDLMSTLQTLTSLPSTDQPFLSVYLNWTPDGNGDRLSLQVLEQEFDRIAEQIKQRDGNLESFATDRQRVTEYLSTEAPVDAQGIAIFACDAESVWEPVPLQVPVETRVVEDRYPHIFELARIMDDFETYAVVLADAQESRIIVTALNEAEQAGTTDAGEEIRRFQAGGWAQMIFQRRTDSVIKAHHKDLADKLGRIIKRYDVQHVIIAGNDSIKGSVREALPAQISDKVVDFIHIDLTANWQAIMETIEPMMREVELEQESDDLETLEGEVGRDGMGVAGASNVAMALTKGQVMKLIMHQGFLAIGGECPNCGTIRPGTRPTCPYDGTEMQQVSLREIFTARAVQQGAEIQIVENSPFLDQHDGVGALLRYRDDVQQPDEFV